VIEMSVTFEQSQHTGVFNFSPNAGRQFFSPFAGQDFSETELGYMSYKINNSILKRITDIIVSTLLLLVLAPAAFLVALAIRLDSPGPVFFAQKRYGAGRQPFFIYKFRTMTVMESEGRFRQASADDDRITRVGRFLRRTSIDELPQLLNVLLGDMSLVGPRPHAIPMDDAFAKTIPNYGDRHLVRPGITGVAQVSGYRGPTEALGKIAVRIRCDRLYIRRWSIWLDFAIMARTLFVLRDPNAL
jgi:putative colanic acid biosynthesis UDP-glucose lipid carrier transferase